MTEVVHCQHHDAQLVITIDHPPANAISQEVIRQLRAAIVVAPDVRVIIITATGNKFFAAGADVKEFRDANVDVAASGQQLTMEMEALSTPIIAAINGIALGGGCEIALACDIRIAADHVRFGQPEINLGIIPGWGGTQRLPRITGRGRAMPLLLSGEHITAATALEIGLVTQVVPGNQLMETAHHMAEQLSHQAPLAVAAIKRAVMRGADHPMDRALDVEKHEFRHVFSSADAREGISAFVEKRMPQWTGK